MAIKNFHGTKKQFYLEINNKKEKIVSNQPLETKNIFNIISWEYIQKVVSLEKS